MTDNGRQETDNETDGSLSSVVRRLISAFRAAGIDNSALDARILIAHALGIERAQLLSQAERLLTEKECRAIEISSERRVRREPVDRIVGEWEFWSLPFGLNEATLSPRPESETLVDAALKFFANVNRKPAFSASVRVLDLGTGSGCLLLALLHEWPAASGLGVDCAARAVEQARKNAERLGLAARAAFTIGNWADGVEECFDLVVSNPPYIAHAEISALMPEVREHDPVLALDGGADGLEAYRLLVPQLPRLLKPNGVAIFEIGQGQGPAARALFEKSGFANIETSRDLGGIERCVAASNAL